MLFNSLSFMVFFPIVFFLYWLLPSRLRWIMLLVASYYFYMCWSVKYTLLLVAVTLTTYISAQLIERYKKNFFLVLGIIIPISFLFVFKYLDFFVSNIRIVICAAGIDMGNVIVSLVLPVGISFYSFQAVGYLVDVRRGIVKAESNLIRFALFISFFPQLVAGPIERAEILIPQFSRKSEFDYDEIVSGLRQMAWGFYKKLGIADVLAVYVDKVYGSPYEYKGGALLFVIFAFSLQIYCDFSGYSDIAIGVARTFGIHLSTNFCCPYFACGIHDFWRRWHITLSAWFKDYLYIPLGGNRVGKMRKSLNKLIIFLLSGLWHGASWNFVIWGGLHGIAQIVEEYFTPYRRKDDDKVRKITKVSFTFLFVSILWIPFRAENLSDAVHIVSGCFQGLSVPRTYISQGIFELGMSKFDGINILIAVAILVVFDAVSMKQDVLKWVASRKTVTRWVIYIGIVFFTLWMMPYDTSGEFVYFQF